MNKLSDKKNFKMLFNVGYAGHVVDGLDTQDNQNAISCAVSRIEEALREPLKNYFELEKPVQDEILRILNKVSKFEA